MHHRPTAVHSAAVCRKPRTGFVFYLSPHVAFPPVPMCSNRLLTFMAFEVYEQQLGRSRWSNINLTMRRFLIFCTYFIIHISCIECSAQYSSNDPFADNLQLDMDDDLFIKDSGSDIVDDLFVSDLSSDPHESLFAQQTMEDFDSTDPNLLADDVHDCTSLTSRFRTRSDFCATERHYFGVGTKAEVQKYWCSQVDIENFASIPVCNHGPIGIKLAAILRPCNLSRSIFV